MAIKISNKKLAKRIAEFEQDLRTIRSRVGEITPEAAEAERLMQNQVNADIATLAKHGYDKAGQKLASGVTKQEIVAKFDKQFPGAPNRTKATVNICAGCMKEVFTNKEELKTARILSQQQTSTCTNALKCNGWKRNCYHVEIFLLEKGNQ